MSAAMSNSATSISAIILAAGKGTRMKSDLPKVVHPVGGRPMVCAVVDACLASGVTRVVAVVGYQQEKVREALASYGSGSPGGVEYVVQDEQLGTGHAVQCAAAALSKEAATDGNEVLVLCGDGPLIRPETIRKMFERHRAGGKAAATLATAVIDDPQGYGRIARDSHGKFQAIVEQKNCTPEQLRIREVNPSYYLFDTKRLFEALRDVKKNALTGEYYLTDTLELLLKAGRRVEVIEAVPPEDVLSINTLDDLAKVDALYRSRASAKGSSSGLVKGGRTP
jgi:bifunctional UDP-N-acetylglucosamine pyrophosphorylase / glucosamine-1-phosphate N-acetyltransferase